MKFKKLKLFTLFIFLTKKLIIIIALLLTIPAFADVQVNSLVSTAARYPLNIESTSTGASLVVSSTENKVGVNGFNTFDGASPTGFHAIRVSDGTFSFAGTADEITYVSGNTYAAVFDASLVTGAAPAIQFTVSLGGAIVQGSVAATSMVTGKNVLSFTATETITGVVGFKISSGAGAAEFTISNFIVADVTGTIHDVSGSGNHGVHSPGSPNWTTDRIGAVDQALLFDGAADYVTLTNAFNYSTFTISAWVETTDTATNKTIIDARDSSTDGVFLYLSPTSNFPVWYYNSATANFGSIDVSGGWHHIALVATTGATGQLYIDGVANESPVDISGAGSISTIASPIIGAKSFSTKANYFDGAMYEVRIYPSALAADEVLQLFDEYNSGLK